MFDFIRSYARELHFSVKDDIYNYLLCGHRFLHFYWLLGDVGEGTLHGELDRVEKLNHEAGDNLEARFLLPSSFTICLLFTHVSHISAVRAKCTPVQHLLIF